MSTKHTPGPWICWFLDGPLPYIGPMPRLPVAKMMNTPAPDAIEANARLIAAAPALLELAHKFADECAECDGRAVLSTNPPDPQDSVEYPCPACADIWAVINQAEGQT